MEEELPVGDVEVDGSGHLGEVDLGGGWEGQSMIFTAADPALWREECTRVGTKLNEAMAGRFHRSHGMIIGVDNSWSTHMELLQQFSKGVVSTTAAAADSPSITLTREQLIVDVKQAIGGMTGDIDDQLQRMSRFENSISLSTTFSAYASTYSISKQVCFCALLYILNSMHGI